MHSARDHNPEDATMQEMMRKLIAVHKQKLRFHFLQGNAKQEIASLGPDGRVFSFEAKDLDNGKRRFVAAKLPDFCSFYLNLKVPRHFYELILEEHPRRPHFDLEFNKEENPELDGDLMLRQFVDFCVASFLRILNIQLNAQNFIILKSSTEKKYSAHVIIHLPDNRLFGTVSDMKRFVGILIGLMMEENICTVKKTFRGQLVETTFIDNSIYSKNRNFRLWMSSKPTSGVVLKFPTDLAFYQGKKATQEELFNDCLVVPPNFQTYQIIDDLDERLAPFMSNAHQNGTSTGSRTKPIVVKDGFHSSPIPKLDEFILKHLGELSGNKQGSIRKWELNVDPHQRWRQIDYTFNNNRYCLNKKAEHKRQNIMWKVDVDRHFAFQWCFDLSDCEGYFSPNYPLPADVVEAIEACKEDIFRENGTSTLVADAGAEAEEMEAEDTPVESPGSPAEDTEVVPLDADLLINKLATIDSTGENSDAENALIIDETEPNDQTRGNVSVSNKSTPPELGKVTVFQYNDEDVIIESATKRKPIKIEPEIASLDCPIPSPNDLDSPTANEASKRKLDGQPEDVKPKKERLSTESAESNEFIPDVPLDSSDSILLDDDSPAVVTLDDDPPPVVQIDEVPAVAVPSPASAPPLGDGPVIREILRRTAVLCRDEPTHRPRSILSRPTKKL